MLYLSPNATFLSNSTYKSIGYSQFVYIIPLSKSLAKKLLLYRYFILNNRLLKGDQILKILILCSQALLYRL